MTETRQIQKKCIELLDIVDMICRKHGIKYSLCGGSVVGAHLYGKCLPWDDDVDLMMTRENYNKLLGLIREELPSGLSVHSYQITEDYTTPFMKIVDNGTTIVQLDGTVSGVFLDITVYDRIPKDFRSKIDVLLWKISQIVMIGKIERSGFKTIVRNFALDTILKNRTRYLKFFQKIVELNGKSREYCYSELFGAYCNTKPFEADIFENYTEIAFENKKYMIVRDYVKYLQTRYERTDFREPKEKQVAPHYKYVDLAMPYKEYLEKELKTKVY